MSKLSQGPGTDRLHIGSQIEPGDVGRHVTSMQLPFTLATLLDHEFYASILTWWST